MLLDDLTLPICRALVAHSNSLKSIDLTFKGHTIEGLANLETVLCGCRNLSVLRLSNAFHTWSEVDGAILLRGVWSCLHLQHIEVGGFVRPAPDMEAGQGEPTSVGTSMPTPQEAGEVLLDHEYEKASGWNVEVRGEGYRRQGGAFIVLKALFARRDSLQMLKRIVADDNIVYSKT